MFNKLMSKKKIRFKQMDVAQKECSSAQEKMFARVKNECRAVHPHERGRRDPCEAKEIGSTRGEIETRARPRRSERGQGDRVRVK